MHESPSLLATDPSVAVQRVNARSWPSRRQARRRARRSLRPGEIALLGRYRAELAGEVLELGSCGDKLTATLAHHASSLTGIGQSGPTVEVCRERLPDSRFLARNYSDIDAFADGQFNAIVAGRCALDLLGDRQRRIVLEQLNRILVDDGALIFSSHNLACESLVATPTRQALRKPLSAWKLPITLRNRAHLARLQQRERGFAILNGPESDYQQLQYHISRDGQERQLFEADFRLLECVTLADEAVARGEDAYRRRELYYVAQPLSRDVYGDKVELRS